MMELEEQINLYNTVVELVLQQIEEEGDEAAKPEYWRDFLKDHPDHAEVYATVAEELSYFKAMAPTFLTAGCESIKFVSDVPGESWEVSLATFYKSLSEPLVHEEVEQA